MLVAKLEETADGCRWLLARWAEFRHLLDSRTHWELPVLLRFIRLQGKLVDESVFDPALNAIFLAWDVIIPKFASHYWEKFRDNPTQAQTACLSQLRWREIAARPRDEDEAWKCSPRSSIGRASGWKPYWRGTRRWSGRSPPRGPTERLWI